MMTLFFYFLIKIFSITVSIFFYCCLTIFLLLSHSKKNSAAVIEK